MTAMTTTHPTPHPSPAHAAAATTGRRPWSPARVGGAAALVEAATYVVGFVLLAAYLAPEGYLDGADDPAAALAFLVDHQAALYAWNVVIYLVAGVALVGLAAALHDRLRRAGSTLAPVATAFGLIWSGLVLAAGMVALVGQGVVVDLHATDPAQAESTWVAVRAVQEGLGGGIELLGAVWVLALVAAGLRTGALGRGLSRLGVVVGVGGLLTVVPALEPVGAPVFGLGFIAWFAWVGRTLLRDDPSATVAPA